MASVSLTDDELVLLDGACSEKVQAVVDGAKRRIETAARLSHLTPVLAGLVADVVNEAETTGQLRWLHERIRHCSVCGKSAGYYTYKSGRHRGRANYDKPLYMEALDFAYRFIRVQHTVAVGACAECVEAVLPDIKAALATVRAVVPDALHTDGAPRYERYERRECPECAWQGHEGEMGRLRTLMGDGTYPGKCPQCGFESHFIGKQFNTLDGFVVLDALTATSTATSGGE